ncbi:MAG TPA: DinB family protein [Chitinophagaceae bacterium]|nr:DinB family protein [Chitinophagaceae bacterium]
MTKQYFIELADFNIWANDIVLSWLNNINDEQWSKHVESSFNSIGETVLHIVSAESVWLERLKKVESPVWLQSSFKGTKDEITTLWKKTSAGLKKFVDGFNESTMMEKLAFKRLNGDKYEMPHYQVFAHLFNHSTYHRGQLVTMLRQVGYTNVDSTDMLVFYRK